MAGPLVPLRNLLGTMETFGLAGIRKKYRGQYARSMDMTLAWYRIDKHMTTVLVRQFSTKGAFGGEPWAPLRPSTKRARQRPGGNRGGINHPLWDFGDLRSSLIAVGPTSIRVITKDSYQRGTRDPKAYRHQKGFVATQWGGHRFHVPRSVPARQVIPDPMPEHVRATWLRIAADHVRGGA